MSNKVLITNSQKAVKVPSGLRILIRRACNAVLEYEHFEAPAEISVTFVDNAAIAELNNQYRWVTSSSVWSVHRSRQTSTAIRCSVRWRS